MFEIWAKWFLKFDSFGCKVTGHLNNVTTTTEWGFRRRNPWVNYSFILAAGLSPDPSRGEDGEEAPGPPALKPGGSQRADSPSPREGFLTGEGEVAEGCPTGESLLQVGDILICHFISYCKRYILSSRCMIKLF